jgi:hypothetical protein
MLEAFHEDCLRSWENRCRESFVNCERTTIEWLQNLKGRKGGQERIEAKERGWKRSWDLSDVWWCSGFRLTLDSRAKGGKHVRLKRDGEWASEIVSQNMKPMKSSWGLLWLDLSRLSKWRIFEVLHKAFPVETAIRLRELECIQWSP